MAAIKIDSNMSAVAYHAIDGRTEFPYAIDAHSAVSRFPQEWSLEPWNGDAAKAGRQFVIDRHARETAEAEARKSAEKSGLPVPLLIEPEIEPTPEEQAAIDEHAKAVAAAAERLQKRREELAKQKEIDDQVAADEALVASPPPRPDPASRPALSKKAKREEFLKLTPEEQAEADRRIGLTPDPVPEPPASLSPAPAPVVVPASQEPAPANSAP